MPTKESLKKAFSAMHGRADYEFFFENLKTPAWLPILRDEGVFTKPEEPIPVGNAVRFPFWPPLRYLIHIAPLDPKGVLETILEIPETENPRVHEELAEAALRLPPAMSAKLVSRVEAWLRGPYQLLLMRQVTKLIVHLLKGELSTESLRLSSALLALRSNESRLGKDEDAVRYVRAEAVLRSEWDYNEALKEISPHFTGTLRFALIELLCTKLAEAIDIEERTYREKFSDLSHIWRGSIEGSSQNLENGIKDCLIRWIRDLGDLLVAEDGQWIERVVTYLRSQKFPIFSRLALHLVRKNLHAVDLVSKLLTDSTLFHCYDAWHEYSLLLQEGFPLLSEENRKKVLTEIDNIESRKNKNKDPDEIDEEADDRSRYWYLFMIRSHLTGDEKASFDELYKKYGDLEHPTFHSYSGGVWVGPTSPKNEQELVALGLPGLKQFLTAWEQPKGHFVPSVEGLARGLEKVVAKDPTSFVASLNEFRLQERTYVRSIIQGLGTALSESRFFDWGPVLDFLIWASAKADTGREEERDNDEDDRDTTWSWTRQAACRLIEKGFSSEKGGVPFELRTKAWQIIDLAMKDEDPFASKEDKYAPDKNYYQVAINSTRGEAIECVVQYGLWVKRKVADKSETGKKELYPEVFAILDRHLDVANEPTKAVRSMYGRWLPWLFVLDRHWTRNALARIFSEKPVGFRESAWNTYILFCDAYDDTFSEVHAYYLEAVNRIALDEAGDYDSPASRLADHLMLFYLRGKVALSSDLIKLLFQKANAKLRAHVIDIVGRLVTSDKKEIPAEVYERAKALWLWRVEECRKLPLPERRELSEIGWWSDADFFEDDWFLDQMAVALELSRGITPDFHVMDRLDAAAEQHPEKVALVLHRIIEYRVTDHGYFGWVDKAGSVLEKLIVSSARESATKMVHQLGALGFNQFGRLLGE